MADPRGFIELRRKGTPKRDPQKRVGDSLEVETSFDDQTLKQQAARCMDCGVAFCHKGCPLGNEIPDWNDLLYRDRPELALQHLHATNNFPEFTGRVCPAPCEEACVLNIDDEPVTIRQIEKQLADKGFEHKWIKPAPPKQLTGRQVAVIGSGPAGMACAQQLARVGHQVTVYERDDRIGGLLRYGIPDFKLEKHHIDRRVEQMRAEGVVFRTGIEIGTHVTLEQLSAEFDALCLCIGALQPRDLRVPGRDLGGVHFAMDYLSEQNRVIAGDKTGPSINANGKRVVILGGGDTGADCLGTAHRQGAAHVTHYHYKPAPPSARTEDMPWPWWPMTLKPSSSHEEGGDRDWSVVVKGFDGRDGHVTRMKAVRVHWSSPEVPGPGQAARATMTEIPGSEFYVDVDLVLLAVGFEGAQLKALDPDGPLSKSRTVPTDSDFRTDVPGVFACGDARVGASLVVTAIWEGREAARKIDSYLMGSSALASSPDKSPL